MNPLKDDKAPYALALLFGAFGWHVGQITDQIKQANTVSYTSYRFDDVATQVIRLENLSDDKYISNLRFEFNCQEDEECIDPGSILAKEEGPVLIEFNHESTKTDSVMNFYLPPASSIFIVHRNQPNTRYPSFKYSPDKSEKTGIFYVSSNSWRVMIAKNYLKLIALSLIMITLIILSTLAAAILGGRKSRAVEQAP